MFIIVYVFFYLISLLPFRVLYFLSDGLYGLIYHIIGYRKKVVMHNLEIAFPEKTELERMKIAKKFYHNLIDYFFESIKLLTITDKEFYKRCSGKFEEINALSAKGINIQIQAGHLFNWEYANKILSQNINVRFVLVYMPISNKIINSIFKKFRTRNETVLVDATNYRKEMLGVYKYNHVLALVTDQSPANPKTAFWLYFFSKPCPFLYTSEKNAVRNNNAVAFLRFKKIKRGYYKFETIMVTENASEMKRGELTKRYRDFLQTQISEQPDNYLWTHRRWKHEYNEEYEKQWID